MTLEEAIKHLQKAGLHVRLRNNEIRGGTLIELVEYPSYGGELLRIENEFYIIQEKQLWLAMKLVGQVSVILKSALELSEVVQATIDFFDLQSHSDNLALLLVELHQQGIAAAIKNDAEIALYFAYQRTVQDTYGFMLDHTANLALNSSATLRLNAGRWYLKITNIDLFPLPAYQDVDKLVQSIVQIRLSQEI